MNLKASLLAFLALICCEVYAQNPTDLNFQYVTPEQGLSQSTVEAIYQDSEGFMWIGTLEGLNKYEGQNQNIVIYKNVPYDSSSLSNNEVECIYEDGRNNLWIGTDGGGLNLYDRDKDSFVRYTAAGEMRKGRLSDNTVHTLLEDHLGNFWLGTYNGLNLMDREKGIFENYFSDPDDPSTLSANYITDIVEDSQGKVWIGTTNGLNLLKREAETFQRYYLSEQDNSTENYIEVIFEDSRNRLWVGTQAGLYIFDRNREEFISLDFDFHDYTPIRSSPILSLTEDSEGILWIGTENQGLFGINIKKDGNKYIRYKANDLYGLNDNSIYSLFESRDGILWIGTFDGGLNLLNRNKSAFSHYSHSSGNPNSLNENSVFALLKAQNGDFFIGTDGGGINLFDEDKEHFSAIRQTPGDKSSLPSDVVLEIYEDSKNRIWVGTYHGGLALFDRKKGTFRSFKFDGKDPTSVSNNQVFEIIEDHEGSIWVGTRGGGVNKLVDEKAGAFKRYMNSSSGAFYIPNNFIGALYEDNENDIWIGTYGAGLLRLDPETDVYVEYNIDNGKLNSNRIFSIYESRNGVLWVGTKGGGIAWYNAGMDEFESFTTQDGLPNDIVNAILEDDHGNLWLSTNNGLSRFNPEAREFKNFDLNDGIQGREFNPGAAFKDENGFMYFGGINGFNKFHPDSIKADTMVSPVALTDFQLFNKSVAIGEDSPLKKQINQAREVVLPYTASVITVKYSVLNYNPRQGYTYAYKLEGFDDEWHYVGNQNTATYTNLDPGEYTFKVKTANRDGIWGSEGSQLALVITPPFWQTVWFYMLAALGIAGLIFGGYRYRLRSINEINKRLEQEVSDRTIELRESNRDLKQTLQDLEETREELVEKAHKAGMADIATGVLHNIGNVLNSITTSTAISGEVLDKSKLHRLFKANNLLRENLDNIEEFLIGNSKGKKLAEYYVKLDESLKSELEILKKHNQRLDKKVHLINNVIAAQQSYASVGVNNELTKLSKVLEDTLTIYSNSLDRHHILVEKHIEETEPVSVQKTKLVHVLLNILKNAKEAIEKRNIENGKLSLALYQEDGEVFLEISDNGCGIKKEHKQKVFTHGFTTKDDGHGFGLHSCANYMSEMGGTIKLESKGENQGATVTLIFQAVQNPKEDHGMAAFQENDKIGNYGK